jgi:glycosyltransferase involved in cell wall biosynthesis
MAQAADSVTPQAPLVSVIIPAFNAAAHVDAAIAAAVAQTYRNIEILVADDGSTDDTKARVASWIARRAVVRWIDAPTRAGRPAVPRNRALAGARGELIAFLDADDLWKPRKLEDQVRVLSEHADLTLVYSVVRAFGDSVSPWGAAYGLKPWPFRAAIRSDDLEAANTIPCSSVMTRRTVLDRVGGFDEDPELNAVEDYDLWLRISRTGPIGFIPRLHGYYRVHDAGISRDPQAQRRRAEYLVSKRHLTKFTFREFKTRTPAGTLVRNLADMAMTVGLLTGEWTARHLHGSVPVWRDTAQSEVSL